MNMSNKHHNIYVPDEIPSNARILFVGEAPGESEQEELRPFIGTSGEYLMNCLARRGVRREDVGLANLCHYRPITNNKFELLLGTDALTQGVADLHATIKRIRPNVIAPLGTWPLKFLAGKDGIKRYRGSILSYINDPSIKIIATYHPSAVVRARETYPIFDVDIRRIINDSAFPEKRLPTREYITNPSGLLLEEWTQRLCSSDYLSVDIESIKYTTTIRCVGFSPSKEVGVCIVPSTPEGRKSIQRILLSRSRKILQNGNFDTIQLIYENGYEFSDPDAEALGRPYFWDTMQAQHVLNPELPASLEFLTSVETREPYYKDEGKEDEKGWTDRAASKAGNKLYVYNCKDTCVTFEIAEIQFKEIAANENFRKTFDYEMQLLKVNRHISVSGLPIDQERREELTTVLLQKWTYKQFLLDRLTGYETNVRSPLLSKILYDKDKLSLPTRRNRDGSITTDEDAIVSLITYCKDHLSKLKQPQAIQDWQVKLAVLKAILEIRGYRQILSNYLKDGKKVPKLSSDGRLRSFYKLTTETGRSNCAKYVDGTGFNAQTLPRDPVELPKSALVIPGTIVKEAETDKEDEEMEDAA